MYFLKQWSNRIKKVLTDEELGVAGFITDLFFVLICLVILPFVLIRDIFIYPIAYFIKRIVILIRTPFTKHWVKKNLAKNSNEIIASIYIKSIKLVQKDFGMIANRYNKKLLEDIKDYLKNKNILNIED